ncbi:hypothetical protein [Embleya sp. NPDC001921]
MASNAFATYLWTVRNTTGVQADKVVLSMDGPTVRQGHFLNSVPPPASRDDGKVVWNLGTLPGNSAKNAIAVFTLRPDQGGKKLGPTAAEARAANAETVSVKDKPRADIAENPQLQVFPVGYPKPVGIGKQAEFSWSLQNGGSDASGVKVTVRPPGELTGAKLTSKDGKVDGMTVTFDRVPGGNTVLGRAAVLTGILNPPHPGAYTAIAEVAYRGKILASVSGTRAAVSEASVAATAAPGNPTAVDAGATATLGWTVSRAAQGPLAGTFLEIDVPKQVRVTGVTVDGHAVRVRDGKQPAPIPPALAKPVTVELSCRIDDELAAGPVVFTATPVWDGAPKTVLSTPVTLTVTRKSALGLAMQPTAPDPAAPGSDAQLIWDADNTAGPSGCSDLTLSLPVLAGGTLLSATVGTLPAAFRTEGTPKKWVIDVGTLRDGDNTQVEAKLDLAADAAPGTWPVTATLAGKNPTAGKNAAGTVIVQREATVTPTPINAPSDCTAGDQVTYSWSLLDEGPSAAEVAFTVTVRGEKTKVTIPPAQAIGATVTTTPAATEITWKPSKPVAPDTPHLLAFIAQTDGVAGQITVTTELTVNGERVKQPDAFHTKVKAAPGTPSRAEAKKAAPTRASRAEVQAPPGGAGAGADAGRTKLRAPAKKARQTGVKAPPKRPSR